MPRIIIQYQGEEWAVDLREGSNVIGRAGKCSIPVKDPSLSREHCEIQLSGNVSTLVDKGSMNGTVVNGKRVWERVLQPSDKITMGQTVVWFEKKGIPIEPPGEAPPAPVPAAASAEAVARRMAGSPLENYSTWTRQRVSWGKHVAWVIGLAAAVGLFFAGKAFLTRETKKDIDRGNLVGTAGSFEGPQAQGNWQLSLPTGGSTIAFDPAQGRNGGACLILDKAGGPEALVAECAFTKTLMLGKASRLNVLAHACLEGFAGWASIKIDWLESRTGPVLAEQFSPPVTGPGEWQPVGGVFSAPAGAKAFVVSLAAVGRAGRIRFDDVSVKLSKGGTRGAEYRLGTQRIGVTPEGVLRMGLSNRRALLNVRLCLDSNKEGFLTQAVAREMKLETGEEKLVFTGKMINPSDLRGIGFEQNVVHKDGATEVSYVFEGRELRQVDRVQLLFTLPKAQAVRGVPDTFEQPTGRIWFPFLEGDVVIEYLDDVAARVLTDRVGQGFRVTQLFDLDTLAERVSIGFRLRETAPGAAVMDPLKEAEKAKGEGRDGEALMLYRTLVSKTRDPEERDKVEQQIKSLLEEEQQEYLTLQLRVSEVRLFRDEHHARQAAEAISLYKTRWGGCVDYVRRAESMRGKLDAEMAPSAAVGTGRPERILERARQQNGAGRTTLAMSMLRVLVTRYPASEASKQAQELLKEWAEREEGNPESGAESEDESGV